MVTVTGDETGYQVAVNGSETAPAGELSQLAETARQAVQDACLRARPVVPAAGGPDGIHRGGGLP